MNPALSSVYIAAMLFGTIILVGGFIAWAIARDNRRSHDGSYGLDQARAKAKARLIENETNLKLNAPPSDPNFKKTDFEMI